MYLCPKQSKKMKNPHAFPAPKYFNPEPQAIYSFWDMVNEAFLSKKIPSFKTENRYYPSQASIDIKEKGRNVVKGSCMRRVYWEKTGEPTTNETDLDSLWKMESGNAISEMICEFVKQRGVLVQVEVPFADTDNKISGRVDLIYKHPVYEKLIGVEIKSVGDYIGIKGVVGGDFLSPNIKHLLQTIIYLDYFQRKMNIDVFEIVYFARCTGERSVFRCTFGENREAFIDGVPTGITPNMIYQRFAELNSFIELKTLPSRDYQLQYDKETLKEMASLGLLTKKQTDVVKAGKKLVKGDYDCVICPFKNKCWNLTSSNKEEPENQN